jgi:uroporphyrinogen-III decarboxylase
MTRVVARTARVQHVCDGCRRFIEEGERYLEHVAAPGHDLLGNTHWWRTAECADCATRYGREEALAS